MKRLLHYVSSFRKKLTIQLIIKIIGTLMDLVLPFILNHIIAEVIPTENVALIFCYGLLMIFCAVIGITFNVYANFSSTFISKEMTKALRRDLFVKIESLSFEDLDKIGFPTLSTRITNDTYIIHQASGMVQRLGVRSPILLLGGLIITFFLDAHLALLLLGIVPLIFILSYVITKLGIPKYTSIQKTNDSLVTLLRENYTGVRVIKALNKEEYEVSRFKKQSEELFNKEMSAGKVMTIINPIMNLILNLGLVAVLIYGAYRVNDGFIDSNIIVAFFSYFTIILNATLTLTRLFVTVSRANASLKRVESIFKIKSSSSISSSLETPTSFISFRNVSFAYNEHKYILDNLSFDLNKGQSLGIIGPTGSGKSTLVALLLKFYNPNSGHIFYQGKDISSIDDIVYRNGFGIASQNDTLFSESIKDNIVFGRQFNKENFDKALNTSQAKDFVMAMENKEDSILSQKGSNLSGGQKQRILIARALYSNPKVLVLDDATSALDYETDAKFRKDLKDNYPDLVLILISSRVASLTNMDLILVMENGFIVEEGNDKELKQKNGLYKEIYNLQEGVNYEL